MPPVTLYGIRNCDTMKKAMRWLDGRSIEYTLHDYKKAGLTTEQVRHWLGTHSWEALLNRRGSTWRKLPQAQRDAIDEPTAVALMCEHPTLVKRPVLEYGDTAVVGFREAEYQALFNAEP